MTDRNDDEGPQATPDYEVGYGRPPKAHQFKKGQSGNPKGRKRKPNSVQAQMRSILLRRISINEGGSTKRLSLQEVILRTFVNKAAKGDQKAAELALKLAYSSEFADTDAIDQNTLSAEERTMLDEVIGQIRGEGQVETTAAAGDDTWDAPSPAPNRGNGGVASPPPPPTQEERPGDG
jgi:hypothetical protein